MKLATVIVAGTPRFGAVTRDGFVDLSARFGERCTSLKALLEGGLLGEAERLIDGASADYKLAELQFLPVIPNPEARIFALGWSYKSHQLETGHADVEFPSIFSKHPQSLVGHAQSLVRPRASVKFDFEGEIVLVIGKAGRHIPKDQAMAHIAGYSILVDGSLRDFQKHSVTAGKNFDCSSSYGPWMVTSEEIPDWTKMELTTRLNGTQMQHSLFGLLNWDLPFIINYISTFTKLLPGDAISTGTPAGVGHRRDPQVFMKAGDVLEVEVTGIGILRNPIVDEKI